MFSRNGSSLVCIFAAGLCAAVLTANVAAAKDDVWLGLLKEQLANEKGCRVTHLVSNRVIVLGGRKRHEGRVRCLDGREYDFNQSKSHEKFELKICRPAVC